MDFSLSDALTAHRSAVDAAHKYWAYYQAVALGAVGFAWSREQPQIQLFTALSLAFVVFAVLSWRVVVDAQEQAFTAATCVLKHVKSEKSTVPMEWAPILLKISTDSPRKVGLWHAALSVGVLAAIWWRYRMLWS